MFGFGLGKKAKAKTIRNLNRAAKTFRPSVDSRGIFKKCLCGHKVDTINARGIPLRPGLYYCPDHGVITERQTLDFIAPVRPLPPAA